jgi:hypothetical protein
LESSGSLWSVDLPDAVYGFFCHLARASNALSAAYGLENPEVIRILS